MATNFYFNKTSQLEQKLVEDLVVESIKIHGLDIKYIPRRLIKHDQIFEEDILSVFEKAYTIEAYVKSVNGYEGQGDLLTKFGLEIRDNVIFVLSQRRYNEEIGNYQGNIRPMEGDIIYFPVANDYFQVSYVKGQTQFFTLGKNYVYELKCDKLEYSSERITTGIPEIDSIVTKHSNANTGAIVLSTEDIESIITESGDNLIINYDPVQQVDRGAQNETFQLESDAIIDFTVENPFGRV